jgi:hypothetical protein
MNCPVVFLTSGQRLTLLKVMLYDEEGVQEVATLRAKAAKSLGSGSLGVGVIGSPSWTLFGEAAAMSIVGGFLSSVLQKQAVEMLQTAQTKSEAVAKSGVFVDFAQVTNSHVPHPRVWCATVEIEKRVETRSDIRNQFMSNLSTKQRDAVEQNRMQTPLVRKERHRCVHNGDEFVNVETDFGAMSIRWDQVAAYFPPPQSPHELIEPSQADFIPPKTPSVDIPPKAPSVNDPETLPVGTTIYDARGVRLAVLPDHSVLARSADGSSDISYPSVEAYRSEMNDREHWIAIIKY